MLQKTLKSPLDFKEIQPVNPKGNQSWIVIARTDAETPVLWLPDAKNWFIWKDPDDGQILRQEERGTRDYEMVGWHHRLSGHEFECWWWTGKPGVLQSIELQRVRHDWTTVLNWEFWKNLGKFYKEKGMDKLSEESEGLGSLLRSIQLDIDGGHPD